MNKNAPLPLVLLSVSRHFLKARHNQIWYTHKPKMHTKITLLKITQKLASWIQASFKSFHKLRNIVVISLLQEQFL